jgi:hypothetical protein
MSSFQEPLKFNEAVLEVLWDIDFWSGLFGLPIARLLLPARVQA